MKNVLLLVHDDDGQESRLQIALDLTRALSGHLSCVDVAVLPAMVGDYYSAGFAEAMLVSGEREQEAGNKLKLENRLGHEDVSWDWSDVSGNLVDGICDAATLADIIVVNRKLEDVSYPDMREVASRILMHVRAPVVAVPAHVTRFAFKRVLIAWDGQLSCAATLRACVPLLRLAEAVEIFMVRSGRERAEPSLAAQYLSRHGIHASVKTQEDGLHEPDGLIMAEAESFGADYIMMGAYSHGRFMETFGGVTKRMLANATLPLVLGH